MSFSQIFSFPKKMELENRERHENLLNRIIYWEGQIIGAHDDYMEKKKTCESEIKRMYHLIAVLKRMGLLKQQGLQWSPADDTFCEEESEKELQRWKNLIPGDKIREHRERISELENDEDWEPMTDMAVDRWIEEENEKEIERLEKLTPGQRFSEEVKNGKMLQEAEKNNWYCS